MALKKRNGIVITKHGPMTREVYEAFRADHRKDDPNWPPYDEIEEGEADTTPDDDPSPSP